LVVAPSASLLVARLLQSLAAAHDLLAHQATTDALTGLRNRRGFFDVICTRYAERDPDHLVVAGMIDVDRFKALNDEHGHHAGDAILVALAARLDDAVAGRAVAGRLGGDEFAIFGVVDREGAEALSQALHQVVQEISSGDIAAVASLGLAVVSPDTDADIALRDADRLLYEHKRVRGARVRAR
jgi:diguanylate cyclase (GGDEF)-like protein